MTDFYCIEDLKFSCEDTVYKCGYSPNNIEWFFRNSYSNHYNMINTSSTDNVTLSPYSKMFNGLNHSTYHYDKTTDGYTVDVQIGYGICTSSALGYNLLDMKVLQSISFTGNLLRCNYFNHDNLGHYNNNDDVDVLPTEQGFMFYNNLLNRPNVYYAHNETEFNNYASTVIDNSFIIEDYVTADPTVYLKSGGTRRITNDNNRGYLRLDIGEDAKTYNKDKILTDDDGMIVYYALKDNIGKPVDGVNVAMDDVDNIYTHMFKGHYTDKDWIATDNLVNKINRHTVLIDGIALEV